MNESLSSGLNPPPDPHFSPFSLTASFCEFFFSYFAPSPLALTFSHCLFFCIFLSSLFSLPLWKVLSKSTLCTKAVWWHKLAAGQRSALWLFFSFSVNSNHSICLPPTLLFPPPFLFFYLHFLSSVRSRTLLLKCFLSNTHTHCEGTEELWGWVLLKEVCLVVLWSLCAKAL